ncbi:uncharacterized protein CLAFUR5_05342 [Fulvia fulva]|uniref:Uncharacterized protein n=1 Tax=Passalora fulva TaxID=5499 RepID=A0A9Q8LG41_PASFU|nr:uncharacterized protein CLAFUR5_05342 [Fulvia fulva]KAK4616663.1 hypothetical protein CLAFUR0_10739 [Fulvia fulva]UJO16822.1 hypothetical protein CLAFUR5_05342 [Fulvia fulva]
MSASMDDASIPPAVSTSTTPASAVSSPVPKRLQESIRNFNGHLEQQAEGLQTIADDAVSPSSRDSEWNHGQQSSKQHRQGEEHEARQGSMEGQESEGLLWFDLSRLRPVIYDLLTGLAVIVALILLMSYLRPLWIWANGRIDLIQHTECPIHSQDGMSAGHVPSKIQDGFAKAAWMLPRHWEDWSSDPPFQPSRDIGLVYWPRATPADDHVHRIERRLRMSRSAVGRLQDLGQSSQPSKAVTVLSEIVGPLLPCLGGETAEQPLVHQIYNDTNMPTSCKVSIFTRWHNFRNLLKIMDNTGRLYDWSMDYMEAIETVRKSLHNVTQELQLARAALSGELERQIVTIAAEAVKTRPFWELPFGPSIQTRRSESSNGLPTQFARRFYHLDKIQSAYAFLLWSDYLVQVMDGVLVDRIKRLEHIRHSVDRLEEHGARSTVRHLFSHGAWHAARYGMIDILPITALGVFQHVETLTKSGEQHHFRAAACAWTQKHMPLHEHCTCNNTKRGKRWHVLRMTEDRLAEQAERQLRHYFWEELEYAKIHWDSSTEVEAREDEAEIKWRWLDIRTHQSCRPAGSDDRPYNP